MQTTLKRERDFTLMYAQVEENAKSIFEAFGFTVIKAPLRPDVRACKRGQFILVNDAVNHAEAAAAMTKVMAHLFNP